MTPTITVIFILAGWVVVLCSHHTIMVKIAGFVMVAVVGYILYLLLGEPKVKKPTEKKPTIHGSHKRR